LFLLKGNLLEIKYLFLCDDEIEDDFQNIVQTKCVAIENHNQIDIKERISKRVILKKHQKC